MPKKIEAKKKSINKKSNSKKASISKINKKATHKKPKKQPKKIGRPLKFTTVNELQKAIDKYFASLYEPAFDMWGNPIKNKDTGEPILRKTMVATVTGLAIALETSRETLLDYEKGIHDGRNLNKEQKGENKQIADFSGTIKKAKLKIYSDTEQQLYKGKATGAIFSLKNNYGWVDKREIENKNIEPTNPYQNLTEEELRKLANE